MKNYKDMSADVFRRRDEWIRKRRQRNRILLRAGSVCAACVLLLSAGIFISAMIRKDPHDNLPTVADTTGDPAADAPDTGTFSESVPSDTTAPEASAAEPWEDGPQAPGDTSVFFNILQEYTAPGRRLVERVAVSAEEFAQTFPLDLSGFPPDAEYAFEYKLDPDTMEPDESAPENGVVTVRDENSGESCHFCVSAHGAIYDSCTLPGSSAKTSFLSGKAVLLFHIFGEKEIIFGELELNGLTITATFSDCDQQNAVSVLTKLIESEWDE